MVETVMTSEEGSGECLKKYLPKMVLTVLLVEADDCTRQIIAALLRKCGYRVAAVPDGLKAWETLKERHRNIDLVLTEVDLPSISGYALLTLIEEHDMCKHIPVIMMSSEDSIKTVLKCMVKGAADFFVKPVRKNELRNLWQHVWRRKIQSAGSRPQDKVPESQKCVANNYSSDNLATVQGGNDKATDAQGITDVICRDASDMCNDERHEECVQMVVRSFMQESKPLANMPSSGMETSSGIGPCSSVAISSEEGTLFAEPDAMGSGLQRGRHSENTCTVDEVDCRLNELYSTPCNEAFDLIGKFENSLADSDAHSYDSREKSILAPRLELSLRSYNPSCSNDQGSKEQNMISYPKASAFSKYEYKKTLQHLYSGSTIHSDALRERSSAYTWEHDASLTESQLDTTALVMRQPGTCKAATLGTQLGFIPVDRVRFGSMAASDSDMHLSMSHSQSDCHQVQIPRSQSPLPSSSLTYSTSEVQTQEHGIQPFDDSTVQSEDNAEEADNGKLVVSEKEKHDSATCGSSNLESGVTNKLSCSSGSISSETERAHVSESVNYNDNLFHDTTRAETQSTSQREAALKKFRLKRKDRCFEKKVRYQSRKRLAEQRPRVKGQFVRVLQNETQALEVDDETMSRP